MDGRANTAYPDDVLDDFVKVAGGRVGWETIIQASPAQYALVQSGSGVAIDALPGWRRAYADDIATVAVRDGASWRC
jgi:hypothetical protein